MADMSNVTVNRANVCSNEDARYRRIRKTVILGLLAGACMYTCYMYFVDILKITKALSTKISGTMPHGPTLTPMTLIVAVITLIISSFLYWKSTEESWSLTWVVPVLVIGWGYVVGGWEYVRNIGSVLGVITKLRTDITHLHLRRLLTWMGFPEGDGPEGEFIPPAGGIPDTNRRNLLSTKKWIGLVSVLLLIITSLCLHNLLFLPPEIRELRGHLINHYGSSFCDIKTVPWNSSSKLELDDLSIDFNLLLRDVDQGRNLVRKPISYSELIALKVKKSGDAPPARRILLRGSGGTGKTTLACKIAHDWSKHPCGFSITCIPLLFILKLRFIDPKNSLGQEVLDQGLIPRDRHGKITADKINQHISQYPESAVIIFDGYDEYVNGSLKNEDDSDILDILRYESFRDTTVIVTSRPWRISDFDEVGDYTHVELTGFTSENVIEYVNKFFRHNATKSHEMFEWLSGGKYNGSVTTLLQETEVMPCDNYYFDCKMEDVSYMARYPLFLAMFCEISKNESLLKTIKTVPDVFNNIIEYMYEHHWHKMKGKYKENFVSFDHLKVALGKPAYDGLWGQPGENRNEKTVFNAEEFENDTIFRLASEIGFLTNIPEHDYYKGNFPRRKVYTTEFFHKFIQEYFASCYLIYLQKHFPGDAEAKLDVITQRTNMAKSLVVNSLCAASPEVSTQEGKNYLDLNLPNKIVVHFNNFTYVNKSDKWPKGYDPFKHPKGTERNIHYQNVTFTVLKNPTDDDKEKK